jgi:hypothetical protein
MSGHKTQDEMLNHRSRTAVTMGVVTIHSPEPFESSIENPLGTDRAPHRIWTWADGSWLLVRFYDDGATVAITSPGIVARISEQDDGSLAVRVVPVASHVEERGAGSPS